MVLGVEQPGIQPDGLLVEFLDRLRGFKTKVVNQLTGGLGQLSKQRKITYVQGTAAFTDANLRRYAAVVFLMTTGDVLREIDALTPPVSGAIATEPPATDDDVAPTIVHEGSEAGQHIDRSAVPAGTSTFTANSPRSSWGTNSVPMIDSVDILAKNTTAAVATMRRSIDEYHAAITFSVARWNWTSTWVMNARPWGP